MRFWLRLVVEGGFVARVGMKISGTVARIRVVRVTRM